MTADRIPALLEPIQNRVDDAKAKRARSRANPDPIWDASMILAIQASSADVPKLLAAVQAMAAIHRHELTEYREDLTCTECGQYWPCPTVRAVEAALDG